MAQREILGTLAALNGVSPSIEISGWWAVHLTGTFVAQIEVQASKDGGASWAPISGDGYGTPMLLQSNIRRWQWEPEQGLLYRLQCVAYTSGTITYALSQCP